MTTPAQPNLRAQLMQLIQGFQVSAALHVAASHGLADHFTNGPRTADDVAAETGLHPEALYRLLRALATIDVFHEEAARRFRLRPMGELLRTDVPGSLAGLATQNGRPYFWEAWGHLGLGIETGANVFTNLHDGEDVWTWRSRDAEESAIFDVAMHARSAPVIASLLASFDFSRFASLADVGGNNGVLISAILARYPKLRGILFDQPHVVAGAAPVLSAAGVADRCEVVGGSFFDSVPAGADAYLLKSVLHDWPDEENIAILRTLRTACAPSSRLLLVERIVGPPNEGRETKFSDLNMLVMPGGKERTEAEWRELFVAGGFALERTHDLGAGWWVMECGTLEERPR